MKLLSGNPASNPQGSAQGPKANAKGKGTSVPLGSRDVVPRQVQCTIDQWFDISKLDARRAMPEGAGTRSLSEVKEFIIAPRNTGRMLFYDEYDKSEKDCMWEEY